MTDRERVRDLVYKLLLENENSSLLEEATSIADALADEGMLYLEDEGSW